MLVRRQRIRFDEDLPAGEVYEQFLKKLLAASVRVPEESDEETPAAAVHLS